jgi:ribosomal protein S18 acetylase RimI-like enzyme
MDPITIRPASLQDLSTLLRFEQDVIATERPFDPTLGPDPLHYYDLHELITASHIQLLVAEYDQQVIGSGYARIETAKHYNRHPQHAYLGFMYVEPAHRGKGVNNMIIAALTEWARSRNIVELRLDVYYHNGSAIKAYEKVGFTRHKLAMRMGIPR